MSAALCFHGVYIDNFTFYSSRSYSFDIRKMSHSEYGVVLLGHFASFQEFFILIQFKMNLRRLDPSFPLSQ